MITTNETRVKNLKPASLRSRVSRILAVQCLYIKHINRGYDESIEDIVYQAFKNIKTFIPKSKEEDIEKPVVIKIIQGVLENQQNIDRIIMKYINPNWKLDRLAYLLRIILEAAIWELLYFQKVHHKIIINEYIEIAKILNHTKDSGFINAVLDRVLQYELLTIQS